MMLIVALILWLFAISWNFEKKFVSEFTQLVPDRVTQLMKIAHSIHVAELNKQILLPTTEFIKCTKFTTNTPQYPILTIDKS